MLSNHTPELANGNQQIDLALCFKPERIKMKEFLKKLHISFETSENLVKLGQLSP